ncbi:HD-GYP domain-containing protein [Iodobacter sp.]|uniref:HD-GYP domain-containing protein n=1 Tax=Iodobacter sp. TaxID=1915058 RepID=UPI0025E5DEE7|nr:HD domain-containing phosphohydrolase [Iodobacter sp.]
MASSPQPSESKTSRPASAPRFIFESRAALDRILSKSDTYSGVFPSHISSIVGHLSHACDINRNVVIGMIMLRQDGTYAIRHAINVACVVELALRDLGRSAVERKPVVAAALTMNIGMYAIQEKLSSQSGPLSDEQRHLMQAHPIEGRDLLRKLGVTDPLWLDYVLQHHEIPDGSGYPQRLAGDDIHFEARLIGIADRYCAMLTRNAWRRGQLSDLALLTSLTGSQNSIDVKLGRLFTQTMGLYPPGAVVQLLNGEIGIVKRPGRGEQTPVVAALFNKQWQPLLNIVERDSDDIDFSIIAVIESQRVAGLVPMEDVWGGDATGA